MNLSKMPPVEIFSKLALTKKIYVKYGQCKLCCRKIALEYGTKLCTILHLRPLGNTKIFKSEGDTPPLIPLSQNVEHWRIDSTQIIMWRFSEIN